MTRMILASSNAGKIREMQLILADAGYEVIGQKNLGIASVEETGTTFVENALLKARHASAQGGMAACAEDSGLCVPALGGAPGLYSARYAGDEATDAMNNHRLLEAMKPFRGEARNAFYVACIVCVESAVDSSPLVAQGFWRGCIGESLQGTGGFGYDPLFWPVGSVRSAAEWSIEEKNRLSHRAGALRRLLELLAERQPPHPLSLRD